MRITAWGGSLVVGVITAFACGSSGKELTNFYCGGFDGSSCPPASQCDGTCSSSDCGDKCMATQNCDKGASCPVAYTCDASGLCIPQKTCSPGTCAADEWCAASAWKFSAGICVPVAALKATPPTPCAWPFVDMFGSACGVPCSSGAANAGEACPPGMACNSGICQ